MFGSSVKPSKSEKLSNPANNENNEKPNNSHNKTMEEQIQLITPGVYRKISSKNDDKPEMIRIIGPAKDRVGYWKAMGTTQKQEIYHEGELTSAWELMDIHASAEHKNALKRKEHLFAGIKTLEELNEGGGTNKEEEEINQRQAEYSKQQQPAEQLSREPAVYRPKSLPPDAETERRLFEEKMGVVEPKYFDPTAAKIIQYEPVQTISPEKQFLTDLFSRLSKSQESEDELEVTVRIPLGFNMNKLKESINLLDLDTVEISSYVVNTVLSPNKLKAAVSVSLIAELAKPLVRAADRLRELQTTKPEIVEYIAPFIKEKESPTPQEIKDDLVQQMVPMVKDISAEVNDISAKAAQLLEKFL